MNNLFVEVSKDVYINYIHYSNPFAQKSPQFYVRILVIKDGWIAYQSYGGNIKYMRFEEFFKVFCIPKMYYWDTVKHLVPLDKDELLLSKKLSGSECRGTSITAKRDMSDYEATVCVGRFIKQLNY